MKIAEIKEKLVAKGVGQAFIDKAKTKEALLALLGEKESVFDGLDEASTLPFPPMDHQDEDSDTELAPLPTDPEWHDYVMGQFTPDELEEGCPNVGGLRRVSQLLIGKILSTDVSIPQCPTEDNGGRATAIYRVEFDSNYGNTIRFSDAADCFYGNTHDDKIAKHPVAMATTRAEARALRKALGLKKVIAAEEIVGYSEDLGDEFINKTQITMINHICKTVNINALTYLRSGETKFDQVSEIPKKAAINMIAGLAKYKNSPNLIPASIKGYVEGWETNV